MSARKRIAALAICSALAIGALSKQKVDEALSLGRQPSHASEVERRLSASAIRASRAMGLSTAPSLVIVPKGSDHSSPAWSVHTPAGSVVGVSEALVEAVPYRVLEAILAHEIAHVARGDALLSRFVPRFLPQPIWRDLWLAREFGADDMAAAVVGTGPVVESLELFGLLFADGEIADPGEDRWDPHPTFSERVARLKKR
jgi:Zn-dependent protease with chaperone function